MIEIRVYMTGFSAERHWDIDRPLPQPLQINVNINVLDVSARPDGSLEAPFIFTVSFTPSVAQLSIRGRARITGSPEETKKIAEDQRASKPPPLPLIQAVTNATMADAILLSRSLNIPPPIPGIGPPQEQAKPKNSTAHYTS